MTPRAAWPALAIALTAGLAEARLARTDARVACAEIDPMTALPLGLGVPRQLPSPMAIMPMPAAPGKELQHHGKLIFHQRRRLALSLPTSTCILWRTVREM